MKIVKNQNTVHKSNHLGRFNLSNIFKQFVKLAALGNLHARNTHAKPIQNSTILTFENSFPLANSF